MQGLRQLYGHTGRRSEWKQLVEEIVPYFVHTENDALLPGQENQWSLVTNYRMRLALEERQWGEAERLQNALVDWGRWRATPALARPAEKLDIGERHAIQTLALFLHDLGQIRRELGRAECVAAYKEALKLDEQIGERIAASICAFNLGHAYKDLAALRDLNQAERWYQKSLDLHDEYDRLGRGKCVMQLGIVAHERFRETRTSGKPEEEFFRQAVKRYHETLALLPADAIDDLAVIHNALGTLYSDAGNFDRAVQHLREAVQHLEKAGNLYTAAITRFNVAVAFSDAGRRADALEYAEAALRGFEPYGARAAEMIEKTLRLIAKIRGA